MIIDAHCHAGLGDGLTGPWDTRAPLRRYLRRAAEAGIDRTIVFSPFTSDYRAANRRTARIVAAHPGRTLGFACVHATNDAGRVERLLREADDLGLRGLKVHRHDGPATREIAEAAARRSWPVLFDVQGGTAIIELLAVEYPTVPWIVPHLGSFADDWWAQRTVIDLVVRHPNVYVDTSGVRRFDLLAEVVARAPGKVIFGSDGPELHPGLELEKVRLLGLPPLAEAAITGGTIRGLVAGSGSHARPLGPPGLRVGLRKLRPPGPPRAP